MTEGEEISEEHIEITQNMWQTIHEEQEKYFEGQEIVGWFLACQSLSMEVSELIQKGTQETVWSRKDSDASGYGRTGGSFFRYENNFLVRQSGYLHLLRKNIQMQNYMLEKIHNYRKKSRKRFRMMLSRHFVHLFRKRRKKIRKKQKRKNFCFSYAAVACLALTLVVAGARFTGIIRRDRSRRKRYRRLQRISDRK